MKKTSLLFLGCCLLAPGLLALAPHPTVLRVKSGHQMLAVVRVHGDDPYAMEDGKEKLIRSTPVYFLENAAGYSDNFVEVPHGALSGRMSMQVLGDHYADMAAGGISGTITLSVPMTAKKTIKGGFVTVAMVTYIGFGDIIVHELPELPAGQQVKVKLEVHSLPSMENMNPMFFTQVFDETGREVRTSDLDLAWEYYAQRDRLRLAKAIQMYRKKFANTDHAAVPTFTPAPIFSPLATLPTGEIVVTLSVSADGTVTDVDAGMIGDDLALAGVTNALGGWLFLPKLKAGEPQFTTIKVPLQF